MTHPIYATIDTLDTFVLADRWMAQMGNTWTAVAPFETAESWFEEDHRHFAPQLTRPIADIPADGILIWRDLEEGVLEKPAAEAAALLRDSVIPIDTMARAMAAADDANCFAVSDAYYEYANAHPGFGPDEHLQKHFDECNKWRRLAGIAWSASRPVPAAGGHA